MSRSEYRYGFARFVATLASSDVHELTSGRRSSLAAWSAFSGGVGIGPVRDAVTPVLGLEWTVSVEH